MMMFSEIATNAADSEYPRLWTNALAVWCPSVQPAGGRLIDWVRKSANTLTGGAVVSHFSGRNVLALGSSNFYALVSVGGDTYFRHTETHGWTIACWIYETSHNTYPVPVACSFNGAASNGMASSGAIKYSCFRNNSLVANTGAARFIGSWNHYCATWSGTSGVGMMFLNGRPATDAQNDGGYGIGDTRIGHGYAGQSVNGYMDDIRVYKGVLPYRDINTLSLWPGIAFTKKRRRRFRAQTVVAKFGIFTGAANTTYDILGVS